MYLCIALFYSHCLEIQVNGQQRVTGSKWFGLFWGHSCATWHPKVNICGTLCYMHCKQFYFYLFSFFSQFALPSGFLSCCATLCTQKQEDLCALLFLWLVCICHSPLLLFCSSKYWHPQCSVVTNYRLGEFAWFV